MQQQANRSCVLFARSTNHNEELEHQIELLKSYADQHDMTPVETIRAYDATSYASITQLLAAKDRLTDETILLVTELTRLGRNTRELVVMITELYISGVEIIAVCQKDQLPSPSDPPTSPKNSN